MANEPVVLVDGLLEPAKGKERKNRRRIPDPFDVFLMRGRTIREPRKQRQQVMLKIALLCSKLPNKHRGSSQRYRALVTKCLSTNPRHLRRSLILQ